MLDASWHGLTVSNSLAPNLNGFAQPATRFTPAAIKRAPGVCSTQASATRNRCLRSSEKAIDRFSRFHKVPLTNAAL